MRPKVIQPANAPESVGPYSHAVRLGHLLFCSGQIPLKADGEMVGSTAADQTRQVLENVGAILKAQGLDYTGVVKATVFMTDLGEFAAMNGVYAEYFREKPPAR